MRARSCDWCEGAIPPSSRADAETCSTRCRQARHRFRVGVGGPALRVEGGHPLRLAYADPPYPGLSRRYYSSHDDYAGEVDHGQLVASLAADYDGWALSTSARALPMVLALCPAGVRVAAWHRGERPTRSAGPLNAWEAVVFAGGRDLSEVSSLEERRIDSLVYRPGVRTTDPRRVVGAKPAAFCRWIFDLLGAQAHDEFVDVFPGSGGVTRAWQEFAAAQHDASSVDVRHLSMTAALR